MSKPSACDKLEGALARIADPKGEGARACLTVYVETAREAAKAADARARSGLSLGPLDGSIVTIKDLFDVAGEPTRAGSKVLSDAPAAVRDAPVVRRLRRAGAVIVAKTNMTEFAFSGIGLNPHYGTPGNPSDRSRIPGGSSSGAAVAVADGMCEIAIGSDTGGSTRIPAALCGVVGFKPSRWRVPTEGAFPLSYSLDSIGPMARTVLACAHADAVMAGEDLQDFEPATLEGLRLATIQGLPLIDLDPTVKTRFQQATIAIQDAGAQLFAVSMPLLDDMARVNARGGFPVSEAFAIHRERMEQRGNEYDPMVRARIARGQRISAADYIVMSRERAALVRAMDAAIECYDALLMPTTPIVAPTMIEVATREGFMANNALLLRNTAIVNFFDLCAISLPIPAADELPVGLMLIGRNGTDRRLLRIGAAVERSLSS